MAHKDPVCCSEIMELKDIDTDSNKDYAIWIYECKTCNNETEVIVKY